jgi:hypothetical protein
MSAFEKAKQFFENVDAAKGWEGCKDDVADGATFTCQSDPLADVKTVEGYCDWMAAFAKVTVPGATYDLHAAGWDEETKTATRARNLISFDSRRSTDSKEHGQDFDQPDADSPDQQ